MEELDLKEVFNLFLGKAFQIIFIVILTAIIGAIYSYGFITPKYSSSTTLLLTGTTNDETASTNTVTTTDLTLNSKLVSTYSELVKSKKVLRQVISNLNLDLSEGALRSNVSVISVKDTEIIKITVANENAAYSARIVNEIAKVFSGVVSDYYNIDNVNIVDEAEVSNTPSNINHGKDIIIFAFAGLVIAVVYVLLANMLDTTVKSQEDIEKGFGLPVLVSIPYIDNFNGEKGGKK